MAEPDVRRKLLRVEKLVDRAVTRERRVDVRIVQHDRRSVRRQPVLAELDPPLDRPDGLRVEDLDRHRISRRETLALLAIRSFDETRADRLPTFLGVLGRRARGCTTWRRAHLAVGTSVAVGIDGRRLATEGLPAHFRRVVLPTGWQEDLLGQPTEPVPRDQRAIAAPSEAIP